jgi:SAM-dependent methyltransferase
MFKSSYTQKELEEILSKTAKRRGWDFSLMKTENQPEPWDYLEIVPRYLNKKDTVLDIGTGGGERFIKLSKYFKKGVGIDIDPEMIKVAKENSKNVKNITFNQDTEKLKKTGGKFDVILCRHAPFELSVMRFHLKNGGYFIIQEVGERNMLNIKKVLKQSYKKPALTRKMFEKSNLKLVAFMEYDVDYIVKDIASLVFWLQALDMLHSDLDGGKALENVDTLNKIIKGNVDQRGFITNEHRYLAIAQNNSL